MVVKPAQFSAPHFAQGIVICRELYAATEKDAMSDNIP
ncbi:IclR family transcriptional regulator, partial [Escherichia coli]|nr:IclR family transcriptional regulator [Escherichia coli]HBU0108602.1 IclR family transcriptional regulator [Klebsiella pneumoniae]